MKTRIAVFISALAVAAVWLAADHRNTQDRPSDFRDAVSDSPNGAIGELKSLDSGTPDIPAPDKAKAATGKRSNPAGKNKAERLDGNWLKPAQQTALLNEIDGVCGDTWCEGQFNYRFTSFECEKDLCSMELFMWDYYGEPKNIFTAATGSSGRLPAERVTCDMKGFRKYGDLMESTHQGQPALSDKLYVAISDCIAKAEETSSLALTDRRR